MFIMKYMLDDFEAKGIYGVGKCQRIKANDYKGIDPNYNIRPSLLEIYETISSSSAG